MKDKERPLCKVIVREVRGPSQLSFIMAKERPPCKAIVTAVRGPS
jgi:hypothetical protein